MTLSQVNISTDLVQLHKEVTLLTIRQQFNMPLTVASPILREAVQLAALN